MSTPPSAEAPAPPFEVSARTSALLGPDRLRAMHDARLRHANTLSRVLNLSLESTASDFLETKLHQLTEYKSYGEIVRAGLTEARVADRVTASEFTELMSPVIGRLSAVNTTIQVLKNQKRAITDDLTEGVPLRRSRLSEPSDAGLLERAYTAAIISRVMSACAKQSRRPFNQQKFKAAVNDWYGITSARPSKEYSWCHVIGDWVRSDWVKAAHIVPKSLHESEVAHIFGDKDEVLTKAENALSLHKNIEKLMDEGAVMIVPAAGEFTFPTQWRCLVLDRSLDDNMVHQIHLGKTHFETLKVRDLHERQLTFLNDGRPRRRYLFFRFVISYLNAKRQSKGHVTVPLETRTFWPSGGEYLHNSTLQALSRSVSGSEIPHAIADTQTFGERGVQSENTDAGNNLAAGILESEGTNPTRLREYVIELSRSKSLEKNPSDTEDSAVFSLGAQEFD